MAGKKKNRKSRSGSRGPVPSRAPSVSILTNGKKEQIVVRAETPRRSSSSSKKTHAKKRNAEGPRNMAASDHAVMTKARALMRGSKTLHPKLAAFLFQTMRPDLARIQPILPISRVSSARSMNAWRQSFSMTIDFQALLTAITAATYPPIIAANSQTTPSTPMWSYADGVPIAQFFDVVCPLVMPVTSATPAGPGVGTYRTWTASTKLVNAPSSNFQITPGDGALIPLMTTDVTFTTPFVAGNTAYDVQAPFATRPVFHSRASGDNREYFWIDVNQPGTVGGVEYASFVYLQVTITFQSPNNAPPGGNFTGVITRLMGTGSEMSTTVEYGFNYTVTGGAGNYTFTGTVASYLPAMSSGFYRVSFSVFYNDNVGTVSNLQAIGTLQCREYCTFASGFLYQSQYATLATLARNFWPVSSTLLMNLDAPDLQVGGRILAANVGEIVSNFYEATSQPFGSLVQSCELADTLCSTAGVQMKNGFYGWARTSLWPSELLPISSAQVTKTGLSYVPVPYSFLPGTKEPFLNGIFVAFVKPTVSSSVTSAAVRMCIDTACVYVPLLQALAADSKPMIPLDDAQWAGVTVAMRAVPNLTCNPWHDWLSKAVNKLGDFASMVARGVETGGKFLLSAAQGAAAIAPHLMKAAGGAAEAAEGFGGIAAMFV